LESCKTLHKEFLPAYDSPEGRKAYEDTLNCVKANFPQYIDELQGTADGAKVPFHEVIPDVTKYNIYLPYIDVISAVSPPHGQYYTERPSRRRNETTVRLFNDLC
jgi:hypothetical protein